MKLTTIDLDAPLPVFREQLQAAAAIDAGMAESEWVREMVAQQIEIEEWQQRVRGARVAARNPT